MEFSMTGQEKDDVAFNTGDYLKEVTTQAGFPVHCTGY
jgi:hypothetical protein